MIINKIRIEEEHVTDDTSGSLIEWPLPVLELNLNYSPDGNGYLLKESSGLGPPTFKSTVVGFATGGYPMFEPAPEDRDIVLKIGLVPVLGQSNSELRDNFYKMIGRSVLVKLMNSAITVAQVSGYISKVEPSHFTNKPEILLTIRCLDPMFTAPRYVALPLADIAGTSDPIFNYQDGTAPTGIDLRFQNLSGSLQPNFYIANHNEKWFQNAQGSINSLFQVTYPVDVNDYVYITTMPGQRRITLWDNSASAFIDIAGYLNAGAVWPMLYPGVNSWSWSFYAYTLGYARYNARYWGV